MPTSEYTPDLARVGAVLRAYTRGGTLGTTEQGTFDDTTSPTGDQVDEYIASAVSDLALRIGAELPRSTDPDHTDDPNEVLATAATNLAAIRAAMFVALAKAPEQMEPGQSPYDRLKALWDEGVKVLLEAVAEAEGGSMDGGGSVASGASGAPSWNFGGASPDSELVLTLLDW